MNKTHDNTSIEDEFIQFSSVEDLDANLISAYEDMPNILPVRAEGLPVDNYTAGDTSGEPEQALPELLLTSLPQHISRRYTATDDSDISHTSAQGPPVFRDKLEDEAPLVGMSIYPQPIVRETNIQNIIGIGQKHTIIERESKINSINRKANNIASAAAKAPVYKITGEAGVDMKHTADAPMSDLMKRLGMEVPKEVQLADEIEKARQTKLQSINETTNELYSLQAPLLQVTQTHISDVKHENLVTPQANIQNPNIGLTDASKSSQISASLFFNKEDEKTSDNDVKKKDFETYLVVDLSSNELEILLKTEVPIVFKIPQEKSKTAYSVKFNHDGNTILNLSSTSNDGNTIAIGALNISPGQYKMLLSNGKTQKEFNVVIPEPNIEYIEETTISSINKNTDDNNDTKINLKTNKLLNTLFNIENSITKEEKQNTDDVSIDTIIAISESELTIVSQKNKDKQKENSPKIDYNQILNIKNLKKERERFNVITEDIELQKITINRAESIIKRLLSSSLPKTSHEEESKKINNMIQEYRNKKSNDKTIIGQVDKYQRTSSENNSDNNSSNNSIKEALLKKQISEELYETFNTLTENNNSKQMIRHREMLQKYFSDFLNS